MGKTLRQLEKVYGAPAIEWLPALYEELGSQKALAAFLGVTQGTVSLWLAKLGFEVGRKLKPKDAASAVLLPQETGLSHTSIEED